MSVHVTSIVWRASHIQFGSERHRITPAQKLVLLQLGDNSGADGISAWSSHGRIVTETGLSEATVKRTLRTLAREAVLAVTERPPRGTHRPVKYALNLFALVSPVSIYGGVTVTPHGVQGDPRSQVTVTPKNVLTKITVPGSVSQLGGVGTPTASSSSTAGNEQKPTTGKDDWRHFRQKLMAWTPPDGKPGFDGEAMNTLVRLSVAARPEVTPSEILSECDKKFRLFANRTMRVQNWVGYLLRCVPLALASLPAGGHPPKVAHSPSQPVTASDLDDLDDFFAANAGFGDRDFRAWKAAGKPKRGDHEEKSQADRGR